jgi:nucleotide-binding universal stress UspA family protein
MKTLEAVAPITLKNVLFATDFSACSNAALPYALAITHQYGAKLYAAHVLSPDTYLFASPESWPAVCEQKEQQQRADAASLEAQLKGIPHQVLSPVGDISDVLFRLVRDHSIDLLVLGTHGRTGLPKLLMGSVAEKIVRQASVPVLTVGPHVSREQSVAEINRILFATDFSDESLAALPYAISFASEHQALFSVLHVLQRPEAGSVDLESNTSFLLRRMEELIPSDPSLLFHPEYVVEFGNVAEQIIGFAADHHFDLIVAGVRSGNSVGTVTHLAHTTAQQLMARATCPVLTVRG